VDGLEQVRIGNAGPGESLDLRGAAQLFDTKSNGQAWYGSIRTVAQPGIVASVEPARPQPMIAMSACSWGIPV
jgi:hypothetical protein